MSTCTQTRIPNQHVNEVYLDASYAIALAAPADEYHERALRLSLASEEAGHSVVTTSAILLEIGNSLARPRHRRIAVQLIASLRRDSRTTIIEVDGALMDQAFRLYEQHSDKAWGFTDCVSFVVMRQRGIRDALTADYHFHQAGFRALLLE